MKLNEKELEELHLVRPEVLDPKARKLFEAIMSIADDRDKYKKIIEKSIEWVENNKYYFPEPTKILNILRGSDSND